MYHTVKAVKTSKNIPITVVPIMGAANVRTPERDSLDLSKNLPMHMVERITTFMHHCL